MVCKEQARYSWYNDTGGGGKLERSDVAIQYIHVTLAIADVTGLHDLHFKLHVVCMSIHIGQVRESALLSLCK